MSDKPKKWTSGKIHAWFNSIMLIMWLVFMILWRNDVI